MWLKLLLGCFFLLMLLSAFLIGRLQPRSLLGDRSQASPRLRLMSWNIGYGDLESDSRAHANDLGAVAKIIIERDPDAVALQELTGDEQLKTLLALLNNRYRGQIGKPGGADRVDAVLIRKSNDQILQFQDVPAGGKFAVAATFRQNKQSEIVTVERSCRRV